MKNVLNMLEKAEGPAASPGDKVEGEVDVEVTEVMELEVGEDTESAGDNSELSEDNLQTVHIMGKLGRAKNISIHSRQLFYKQI